MFLDSMNDIYVRLINLPSSVKGVTVLDENDDYNIYINQKLSPEQQKKVYEHEKNHIENGDFHNFDEIEEDEIGLNVYGGDDEKYY